MNSPTVVACREVFDENSQPSAEEVSEYAQQLGIDPESESHLLPLAKDGLMQALPTPWKAYFDEKLNTHYYYNEETKQTQWEHPLDKVYKDMVRKARDASTHDDTYASLQELLTSEEMPKNIERVETKVESEDEDLSTDSNNVSDTKESTNIGTGAKRLQPLSGRPPLAPITRPADKKLSDLRLSPLRRSIDSTLSIKPSISRGMPDLSRPFDKPKLLKQQSEIIDLKMHVLNSPDENDYSPLMSVKSEKGFTLTGRGSMFLKSKKPDLPSPDTEKSFPLDSVTKSDPPKGILREKTDILQKRSEITFGKPKITTSFEDDKKSVRFNLENSAKENTMSPGSNSSSEQNEGHSVISSSPVFQATPSNITPSSKIVSSISTTSTSSVIPVSPVVPMLSPKVPPLTLAPLVNRPPLPPRSQPSIDIILSPRDNSQRNSVSGSERDSNESDYIDNNGISPRRRVLRPPAADYIKPDLFQKNFQKISDLVRPGDIEPSPVPTLSLEEPIQKEIRPRSPMIPLKNKISINLMESIDSETSIDSPEKEFANLDLNDLDDSKNESLSEKVTHDQISKNVDIDESVTVNKSKSESFSQNKPKKLSESASVPVIKVPKLELYKTKVSGSEDSDTKFNTKHEIHSSETNSRSDSLDLQSKDTPVHKTSPVTPVLKISPNLSLNELKSPRTDFTSSDKSWTSPFKPVSSINKTMTSSQIKSSESSISLSKVTSPRLDGVILSQSKNAAKGSDNVVVVYQFETNGTMDGNTNINSRLKTLNHDSGKEMIERTKADEKRRLEIVLQKELEEIKMEWAGKERRMKAELLEELREAEERFVAEKRKRITEQAEKHRQEIDEAIQNAKRSHEVALESITSEYDAKLKLAKQEAERKLQETMYKLKEEHSKLLKEEQTKLRQENERALSETREQLHAILLKERSKVIEENRSNIESLREEHTARITELRHDYRAEVERLRSQHACHLEELRGRLANERAASARRGHTDHSLADKYRCLKEKYARLKHDVKSSIERRNKRREMSMTTGSETEKSNSHKATQSLDRCKELNEASTSAAELNAAKTRNNNPIIKYNDNETSLSESNAQKSLTDNNNDEWKNRKDKVASGNSSMAGIRVNEPRAQRRVAVAFREPPRRRRDRDAVSGTTTDCQDSSDATTADEKPKETLSVSGHSRRRCFTRLKSASTSRLNYSPKRGEGWSSPLESLRQQLRKLDDLEDQFPDLACQPAYSLRYPFTELETVDAADTPELEFVRHRALVEREGMRRARAVLRRRRTALRQAQAEIEPHRAPSEEREATELEVALHRARALLGEKEIRLRHIERSLRQLSSATHSQQPVVVSQVCQEGTTSDVSSGSDIEVGAVTGEVANGAVLRSLRALHADVRDIWLALDARRPPTVSPDASSCNAATPQPRITSPADPAARSVELDSSVAERARGIRAWLHAP